MLMSLKFIKSVFSFVAIGVLAVQCNVLGTAADEGVDPAALAALLVLSSSDDDASTLSTIVNITNNSGGTATYTLHVSGSTCSNTASATTGAVANGAVGSASASVSSSGYDISDGTNCVSPGINSSAATFTCTDAGSGTISC